MKLNHSSEIIFLLKIKKAKTATLSNIVTFQVEQTTISQEISYELTNSYNFQQQDKSKIVTFQVQTNSYTHLNWKTSPY